jgi:hypothetical protein
VDIPVGTVTVTATVAGVAGIAQVVLASGAIRATHANELLDALTARGVGQTHLGFAVGGRAVTLSDVVPGAYTLCGVAFPIGIQSVRDAAPLRDKLDLLPVLCAPVTITDAPTQTIAVPVPAPPTM